MCLCLGKVSILWYKQKCFRSSVSAQGFIELITIFRLAVGQQAWGCVPRNLKRQKRHHCVLSLFCLHMHTLLSSFAQNSKGKGCLGILHCYPAFSTDFWPLSKEQALSLLWLCGAAPSQHDSKCKAVTGAWLFGLCTYSTEYTWLAITPLR